MGYYSDFLITTHPLVYDTTLKEVLAEETNYPCFDFDNISGDIVLPEAKWYNRAEDMGRISLKFPGVIFTVKAYGEEDEDISILYAKDGIVEEFEAEITFPQTTLT